MGKGIFTAAVTIMLFLIPAVFTGTASASGGASPGSGMLQFRAGNHILGFARNKAYLASLDHALSVEFLGTNGVMPKAEGNEPAISSPAKAQSFKKVVYQDLWDGITLAYEATKDGLTESAYHVAPGADVAKIRLRYNTPVEMQMDGSLKFKFATGNLTESMPIAWQEIGGKKVPVQVAFSITAETIGFKVGKYDKTRPLIIDPTYQWHTVYCGDFAIGNFDIDTWYTNAIAVDTAGNIYVAGWTRFSCDGPGPHGPIHPKSGGNSYSDIYVVKLSSSGAYQWHTFYGGAGTDDDAFAVAVDIQGNVYVTGVSLGSWLGDGNAAPKHLYSGKWDIFVLKLDTNGIYQWHTFYGSGSVAGNDWGQAIAVDPGGNVYVTGGTYDTWNGDNEALPVHQRDGGNSDIFVLKLDSNGLYKWHTFYGGGMVDLPGGIGIDYAGFVYVSGYSQNSWQGDGAKDPLHAHGSELYDIFVLKLSSSGTYQWHTFYPGYKYAGPERVSSRGLAVDGVGSVYVSGTSSFNWTGPSGQNPVHPFGASFSTVVLKLTGSGTYQWHTFYGGGTPLSGYSDSSGWGITVDNNGGVYLTGYSNNSWGSPLHPQIGGYNFFVLKLSTGGGYLWDTFYGANNTLSGQLGYGDYGSGIAVDGSSNVYVTGHSDNPWNGDGGTPPIPGSSDYAGNFVLKLSDSTPVAAPTVTTTTISAITNVTATSGGNVTSDGGDTVSARGVCWETSANPTTTDTHTTNGTGTGSFTSLINGLTALTGYHVRAYATNSAGTAYGDDISFTTNYCTIDVQRGGTSFGTIQDALTSGSGAEIKTVARVFQENLSFSNSSDLTLNGGYACGFGSASGVTTVHGTITIAGSAAVTMGNIAVQ